MMFRLIYSRFSSSVDVMLRCYTFQCLLQSKLMSCSVIERTWSILRVKNVRFTNVWFERSLMCRWILLVDHSSSIQAKVRGREGQGWWWPHPGQCGLREILGKYKEDMGL